MSDSRPIEAATLHQQIMNLPIAEARYNSEVFTRDERVAYQEGHRDARHAAAELVLASAPIEAAQTSADTRDAERYRWLRGEAIRAGWLPSPLAAVLMDSRGTQREWDAAIDASMPARSALASAAPAAATVPAVLDLPELPRHAGRIEWPGLAFGKPVYTADQMRDYARAALSTPTARPTDDALWDQTLTERGRYHETADALANAIADHLGIDIGEHSSANDPWQQALIAIREAPTPTGGEVPVADMVYFRRGGSATEDCLPVRHGMAAKHVGSDLITRIVPLYDRPTPAAAAPRQLPEGFVLVPREPTQEMLVAGWNAYLGDMKGGRERFAITYRAMLAASGAPAGTTGATEGEKQ